jgi:hypothetical protein
VKSFLRFFLLSFSVAAIPAALQAAGEVHVWYDENGQAVYSQFPPGEGRASRTIKPPPPPAESPEQATQKLQQQIQSLEDAREDRSLARQSTAEEMTRAEQLRKRCEAARTNLEGLKAGPRQLFRDTDGKIRRFDEAQRQARRAEMEKIIAEDCK